jgi:hypothetical protein
MAVQQLSLVHLKSVAEGGCLDEAIEAVKHA